MKLLLMSLVLVAGSAQAAVAAPGVRAAPVPIERIIWLKADASKTNPTLSYIAGKLPQIRHEYLSANSIRSWQMIQRGEPVCRALTVRTAARESEAYFTDQMLAAPAELLMRKSKLDLAPRNKANEVDLAALLSQGQLQGAVSRGRSYGEHIDQLVSQYVGSKQLADYATAGYGERLQDMLTRGRTDYLIDSGAALAQMRQRQLATDDLIRLPIQGATQPLVISIACPRTPWGLAAIQAIDEVLGTPEAAAHLRKAAGEWGGQQSLEQIKPLIEQFYARRSKPQFGR
ncbi:hypothetical protein WG899_17205 [Paucibacter sp. AS339]|uniref:hypothetical protein n=1 Tax=Paucibacter hankyongi TaxID=3133434 RepID=UPI0030A7775D